MILTKAQMEEFRKATMPLMKWLNDNCHPHYSVIVESGVAELVEGHCVARFDPNYEMDPNDVDSESYRF
jgi:hypothetical protein